MGQKPSEGLWIVDPEPLLLLTLEFARQDSRVFDEVLDLLVYNRRWIIFVRLGTLLNEDEVCSTSLVGAVAAVMMQYDKGPQWRKRGQFPIEPSADSVFENTIKHTSHG